MKRKLLILTSLFCICGILIHLSCGRDCPTCPKEPTPGSYYVYITDMSQDAPGYIWVANSKADSIIDSIFTPDPQIALLDISPNKQYLAALATGLDLVFVFDLDTREIATAFPAGVPYFSPDGAYLLIADSVLDRLDKISVPDWSIIATDTMTFSPRGIFNKSPIFFGDDSAKEYTLYNYESMEIIKIDSLKRPDGSTPEFQDIITSPDDDYFYFTSSPNKIFKFEIETDSIVDSFHVAFGAYYGHLKNSPDGKYLLLTETEESPYLDIGNLVIINQSDFSLYRRILTYGLNPYNPSAGLLPDLFDITPDASKVVCGNKGFGLPPVSFNLLDLSASTIRGFGYYAIISDIAIGKEIE